MCNAPKLALACALLVLGAAATSCSPGAEGPKAELVVYKTETCGCCGKWVDHLREHGFSVTTQDVTNLGVVKRRHQVAAELASCHTALVDGYVVEGHVPADVIARLLEERPPVVGLTVPGMPMGSPGMEGAYVEPYEVLTFDAEGRTEVYARRGQ